MSRARSRSASHAVRPWCISKASKRKNRACMNGQRALRQDCVWGEYRRVGSRKQCIRGKVTTRDTGVCLGMKPSAFAGRSVMPSSGPMPAPVFLYNNGYVVYLSQRNQRSKQSRRRRRSTPPNAHARKALSGVDETVYVCPPASYLVNEFHMRRAWDQRAAAAAQQVQSEPSWLSCPPAPLLTNEFYMQRAERERAAAQQQTNAAADVAEVQFHQPCMSQLQQPSTPSVNEQQLGAPLCPAVESEQHDCAIHSPANSAVICSSSQEHFSVRLPAPEDEAHLVSWHCQSTGEGDEEVCTWDPEAFVVIESF